MPDRSLPSSRPLLAAAAAALLLASTSAGHAGLFNWGKPAPADAQTQDGGVVLAQSGGDAERLNQIEKQTRELTGQVEELTHQLQLLQDQLKRLQDDAEFRFSELEKGGAPAAKGASAPPAAAAANQAPAQTQTQAQVAETPPPVQAPPKVAKPSPAEVAVAQSQQPPDPGLLGAPPKPLGTLSVDAPAGDQAIDAPPAGQQPLDLSSLITGDAATTAAGSAPANGNAGAQVASIAPTGDPRADYNQAYRLVTDGRYDLAETAFRQFLQAYPNDELAPDAQYWLGESLYNHDYAAAAQEFKIGYQKYPKAKRAPDMLLKLGLSMAGLGYRDEACKMYALSLKQYPQMPNGLRQRVKTEQASASC